MFNQSPIIGLVSLFFLVLITLSTQVEAKYGCCLETTSSGFGHFCDSSKTENACKNSGFQYYKGFVRIGNGCDLGDLETTNVEARRKLFNFESRCGGRYTYKVY
ncbi:uncharacterized protein EV154DRAFT_503219 [Mucor mucedo]|uniref:uncharacterized protein n=1 Tax=Mucor mucedo TaxID=29922 RepID=UPI00221F7FED|nr:uncharacterized protein EV154DRAFT_503219 [Mucor mucedo]KAI7893092.1 hypothetical protein EV154DRAFT_503219 [Mucor mucedo]